MLRAVPPAPDPRVTHRLRVDDGIALWTVQDGEYFRGDLVITDPSGAVRRHPVTDDHDNVEALIARLHVVKQTVLVMLAAGFALPAVTRAA